MDKDISPEIEKGVAEIDTIMSGAMQDAVTYGVGLVRITTSSDGMIIGRVTPEEYPVLKEWIDTILESDPQFTKS